MFLPSWGVIASSLASVTSSVTTDWVYVTNLNETNDNAYYIDAPALQGTLGEGDAFALKFVGIKVADTNTGTMGLWSDNPNILRIASADISAWFRESDGTSIIPTTTGDAWNDIKIGEVFVVHLVGDGTNFKLYFNGNEAGSVAYDGTLTPNTSRNFNIGHFPGSNILGDSDIANPPTDVGLIAYSWVSGSSLNAAQVETDYSGTSPSNLHLTSPKKAYSAKDGLATTVLSWSADVGSEVLLLNTTDAGDPPLVYNVPNERVWTVVSGCGDANNSCWYDGSQTFDFGAPGATNIEGTIKVVFTVEDKSQTGLKYLLSNIGGNGGLGIQGGYTAGGDYQTRLLLEDDLGTLRITPLTTVPDPQVGDVIVVHGVLDSAGTRIYANGGGEQTVAFTTGYGQFNSNGGLVIGAGANTSGFLNGSTNAPNNVEGVNISAVSYVSGTAFTAEQIADDATRTTPAAPHLSGSTHAWDWIGVSNPKTTWSATSGSFNLSYNTTGGDSGVDITSVTNRLLNN